MAKGQQNSGREKKKPKKDKKTILAPTITTVFDRSTPPKK